MTHPVSFGCVVCTVFSTFPPHFCFHRTLVPLYNHVLSNTYYCRCHHQLTTRILVRRTLFESDHHNDFCIHHQFIKTYNTTVIVCPTPFRTTFCQLFTSEPNSLLLFLPYFVCNRTIFWFSLMFR